MRINEIRAVCRCGKCSRDPQLITLELMADGEAEVKQLEQILAALKSEAESKGNPVIESGPSTPAQRIAVAAKLRAAPNN